ncbi:PH domain-containing protein [Streptomyces longispororuber]|uniref:PH domain-containing protein n=1 Tax=Streptomyces longispororuber TaxID=68230 RepID=UPI00210924E2|nr:PH domain-containing protein [Streptomyces longispororuber]MCQ4206486.1 PH domain-containing protein [Streptomyces longispororuber]
MSDVPDLPVTFRPGRTRVILHALGAASFVTITVIALILNGMSPGERISFVFTAALFWGVLGLLARPKVVADDQGVTVVNVARSRRLSWAEIVQVNLRPGDPWVFLNLTDGTSMAAMGIQPGIAKHSAIRDAKALRALTEAAHTGLRG